MKKFYVGDRVKHDYSGTLGEVRAITNRRGGYNYYVYWHDDPERSNWYKAEVLVMVKEGKI